MERKQRVCAIECATGVTMAADRQKLNRGLIVRM